MPRYAYQKPVNRLYSYNRGYMSNYYKPMTHFIEKKNELALVPKEERSKRAPSEQPGHQSLAERLKTFPMDGTIYRPRATSLPPARRRFYDDDEEWIIRKSRASRARLLDEIVSSAIDRKTRAASTFEPLSKYEVSDEELKYVPLWMKHPYRLPVEDIVVPPHESSIWPESVPHFNLVSSYDTMIGYLGLKHRKMYR